MDNKISLTRHADYNLDTLITAIDGVIKPIGGWGRYLFSGAKVILKVNLVSPARRERNALTDPTIVEALIHICGKRGCIVRVCDASVFGSIKRVAKSNGIFDVCERHNIKLWQFDTVDTVETGRKPLKICKEIQWADRIINLPKLKAHGQLYYSGAIKNLFGCVVGKRKFIHHIIKGNRNNLFADMLLDIARHVSPCLNILDGIHAMSGDGPMNGHPVHLGLLGAATNPLALDIAVVDLLAGDRSRVPYFQAAKTNGFWKNSFSPDVQWINRDFIPKGFSFPGRLKPIRFSFPHSIKSAAKSISAIIKGG
jgi:uncharacterized protein (DUF362 family)